ncbi:MAG: DMT family transporter [Gemmatimonas sp.]
MRPSVPTSFDPNERTTTVKGQGNSAFVVLAASLLGLAFAAPLIRMSAAPALVIASWRLGLSLVVVAVALLATGSWRAWRCMGTADFALAAGAGMLLALHFWSWNQSLQLTSVAASVSLVNMQPLIIAVVSARWLGEQPSRRQWIGIGVSVAGAMVVGLSDVPGGAAGGLDALTGSGSGSGGTNQGDPTRALLGDALAFVGAVTGALYYLIGRRVRQSLPLWPYVGLVYGAAFVACASLAMVNGDALGPQPGREIALFTGLAVGPMLLGHTGMNWALGHLPAYIVNLTTLGEPIGATILAASLPGIAELPGRGTLVGGALVLAGVVFAARK